MAAAQKAKDLAAAAGKGYWREGDARQVVRAWERSGQTLSRFAAARGLKAARLARWANRLRKQADRRGGRGGAGTAPLKLRFHPVELVGPANSHEASVIEVVLLDGRRVRVPAGFAGEDLERVLRILDERSRC
jgi:hypothetical protein